MRWCLKPCPDLLTKMIDRQARAGLLEVPEGPAVAGRCALYRGADLMDRAAMIAERIACRPRAVGAYARVHAATRIAGHGAGLQQTRLDQHAEGDARLGALAGLGRDVFAGQRLDLGDALARDRGVIGIA